MTYVCISIDYIYPQTVSLSKPKTSNHLNVKNTIIRIKGVNFLFYLPASFSLKWPGGVVETLRNNLLQLDPITDKTKNQSAIKINPYDLKNTRDN